MKFLGLPKIWAKCKYSDIKKVWDKDFAKKHPDADFDEEWKKIGGELPTPKKKKEEAN